MNPSIRIGIDLGGTKIEAVALDAQGREHGRRRIATPRTYDQTLAALAELVQALETELAARATVGVGMPGALTPGSGCIRNSNSTWLNGRPLDADLGEALERPVRVMNDANCFALSEAQDGAAAGAHIVFGVILGTGVGGGLVVGGHVLAGHQGIGGEWGHNPLPWPNADERSGPECHCGKRGCIETWCSGPAMAADHERASGAALTTHEIISAAAAGGGAAASATLDRYIDRLARSLATVVNVVDPDVIVLGGGMSNLPSLAEHVGARMGEYVICDDVTTRVVRNLHGDSSGVRGAAWLWPLT